MSYSATVIEVMIASPGDIIAERQVIREVLNEWNTVHARARAALLLPVGWETHSAPELGGRPQQMINDRLLAHCDLLVGVFWTRLGSPTGVATSGTVEEIEEHRKAGKPAMLYFSGAPVVPSSLDADQYEKLKEFKAWAMTQGLVATFDSAEEFREKFRRELELNLRDNEHLASLLKSSNDDEKSDALPRMRRVSLTDEAAELLAAAAGSDDGMIVALRHLSGASVTAGGKQFVFEGSSARDVARWMGAIRELRDYGLVEATSYKAEVFRVTDRGYDAAAQIPAIG